MILPSVDSLIHGLLDYLAVFAQTSNSDNDAVTTHTTVRLDDGTFIGLSDGVTSRFLGIPYAQPPVGNLRFDHPIAPAAYAGTYNASVFGPSCPQHTLPIRRAFPPIFNMRFLWEIMGISHNPSAPQSEDCLSLNVWTPADIQPDANLPIVVWIHGGVYQIGSSAFNDGKVIVERAVQIGEPVILVSMNYRLSALGFLTGKEAQEAGVGNLGYRDQRLALQWIQRYIHHFGGDPSKVVIWGHSAGAMSVAAHMVTNSGDTLGLFRGAYMQSGSIPPLGDMRSPEAQRYYDALVADVGCQDAQPSTLECLRQAPFERLKKAIDASPSFMSYQSLATSWGARTDGDFLPESPRELASKGIIAHIPFVIGTCDDEGTVFALPSLNISTTFEVLKYLSTYFFSNSSIPSLEHLLDAHYPQDPTFGAPFGSGPHNKVTTQFKRLAALVGDWMFEAPKRALLEAVADRQDVWTFVSKRQKSVGVLGAAHSTDVRYSMFTPSDMTDHLIHFVNYLNPNGQSEVHTPLPSVPSPDAASDNDYLLDEIHDVEEATTLLHVTPLQQPLNTTYPEDADEHIEQQQEPLVLHVATVRKPDNPKDSWPRYDSRSKAVLLYTDGKGAPRTQVVHGFEREEQVAYLNELSKEAWVP